MASPESKRLKVDKPLEDSPMLDPLLVDKNKSIHPKDALKKFGFIDADMAGGPNSKDCTLILIEGISAKAFVRTGLNILGCEKYGVYPLRGKIRNMRRFSEERYEDVMDTDSKNIARALGLGMGMEYSDTCKLRYGNILIMTDQDADGAHIKGLIINMFDCMWPSLLQKKSFLKDFTTALFKVKHKRGNEEFSFKSLNEYRKWEMIKKPDPSEWTVKYYKHLASNSEKEAIQYFEEIEKHLRIFEPCQNDTEMMNMNNSLDTAFGKGEDKTRLRKEWLKQRKDGHCPNFTKNTNVETFINEELIVYFNEDTERSIPSLVDGLKQSQRKVLFSLFERDDDSTALRKVFALAGFVSAVAAYHHGETVLEDLIIRMAQDFVGSNNINLLLPLGQFGSRKAGGRDHGDSTYIDTALAPIARFLFPDADDNYLKHKFEDGKLVEPDWYAPLVPLVLINGARGIGSGASTRVPSHNPTDLIENIRRQLDGKPLKRMVPWYCGYEGNVDDNEDGTYTLHAKWNLDGTKLKIDDLPPGVWYDKYEEILVSLEKKKRIKGYKKIIAGNKDLFEIDLTECLEENIVKKMFKLSKKVSTSNMVLFDAHGQLKRYSTTEQVNDGTYLIYPLMCSTAMLKEFYDARYDIYCKRKDDLEKKMQAELQDLESNFLSTDQAKQRSILYQKFQTLKNTSAATLWRQDLARLEREWNSLLNERTNSSRGTELGRLLDDHLII